MFKCINSFNFTGMFNNKRNKSIIAFLRIFNTSEDNEIGDEILHGKLLSCTRFRVLSCIL